MTLVRFNPNHDLAEARLNMNRLFHNFFEDNSGRWPQDARSVVPAVNLEETEEAYKLTAELPGLAKEDISITLEENVLCLKGEKKASEEVDSKNFHRSERSYGKFQRSFELPGTVDRNKIEANYKDGVLTVSVPKAEEAKPKQIEIKVK